MRSHKMLSSGSPLSWHNRQIEDPHVGACTVHYTVHSTVLGAGLCLERHWLIYGLDIWGPGLQGDSKNQSDTGCLVNLILSTSCHPSDGHHASDGDQWNVSPAVTRGRLLAAPVAGARAESALRAARRELGAEQTEECCQSPERTWSWHKTRLVSFPCEWVSLCSDRPGQDWIFWLYFLSPAEPHHTSNRWEWEDTPAPAPREREHSSDTSWLCQSRDVWVRVN